MQSFPGLISEASCPQPPGRRRVLQALGAGALSWLLAEGAGAEEAPLRFGVITDVHQDIMHDAGARLRAFVDRMQRERVDFVIQLGDFCVPHPKNREFLAIWKRFPGPRYHVLGNHDMDGDGEDRTGAYGYRRAETVAFWGMERPYYSFDRGGFHFVVLDGNDRAENPVPGYRRYLGPEQLEWLRKDLAASHRPTVLFIHQPLERPGGVQNQEEVRAVLEAANREAGRRKVVACFAGHYHRDYAVEINGIHYAQVNSASYFWVGPQFARVRYGDEVDRAHPSIKYTVPYREPLWAVVTLDPGKQEIRIEGARTEFVGPAPWELGRTYEEWDGDTIRPAITGRRLRLG
ncbi:MAG: metallophosphoesterase family protein [Armatimonadota bacterium]